MIFLYYILYCYLLDYLVLCSIKNKNINMDSENEIIIMGHESEYEGKCNLLSFFHIFLNASVSFYLYVDEFQGMVVEEYEEEHNGEEQANYNQAYNSSVLCL